jgi:uncharacterized protein (TIGR02246 family)
MTRALATIASLTLLIGLHAEGVSSQTAPGGEARAAEATVRSFFDALEALDFEALARTVTSDMELVEDTLILDMPGFVGFVRPLAEGGMRFRYRLTDFNTEVRGPVAWTRYRNEGVMTMEGQERRFDWIESAVLERGGEGWRIDRLQSAPVRIEPPLEPDPATEAATASEISREVDRAIVAWMALEPHAYLDLFSDDVTWLYEGAGIDRATFEAMVRGYMAAHTQAHWTLKEPEVEVLGSDAAVVSGRWSLTQTDMAGLETEDAGAITLVYERRNGEWKIVHAHESLPGAGSIGSQGEDEASARSSSMDAEAMKEVARRWIRGIWDEHDVDLLDELAIPGYTYTISNDEPMDREAFAAFVQSIGTAFPDLRNTIEEQVVEDDLVITRGVTVATHGGPLGELEATGRTVSVPFVMFTRLQDGKVASDWELFDQAGMMAQLAGNDN